ncbi:MAG: TetR/AcrR family transcriptional regulator [Candidatus Binataceae bacterium]
MKSRASANSIEQKQDGRRQRGEQARAAVLQRAMQVASTQGLEGLTIGSLANDLGISKGNITVLFGDKESLQLKTLDSAVEVFIGHVIAPHYGFKSPLKRLKAWCGAWFDYVERRILPGGCMLYGTMSEYRARPGAVQERVKHHRMAWTRLLVGAVREAVAAGELKSSADAEQLVFELIAFQSAANTAALLGDEAFFRRARRATLSRLALEEVK